MGPRASSGDGDDGRRYAVHAELLVLRRVGGGEAGTGRGRRGRAAPGDTDPGRGRQPAGGAPDGGVQAVEPGVPAVAPRARPRRLVPPLVRPLRPPRAAHQVLRRPHDALLRRRRRRLPQRARRRDQGLRLRLHLHPPLPRPKPQAADGVHEHPGQHAGEEGRLRGGPRPVRRALRLPVRAGRAGAPVAGGHRVPAAPPAAGGVGVRGQRREAGDPDGAQPRRPLRAAAAGAEPAPLARGARGAPRHALGTLGRVGAGDAHLRLRQHAGGAARRRLPHPRRAAERREQPVAAAGSPGVRQHHAGGVEGPRRRQRRQPLLLRQEHDAVPPGHRVRGGRRAVPVADPAARRDPAGARGARDVPGGHRGGHGGEPRVRGRRLRRAPGGGGVRRRRRDGEPGQPRGSDQGVVRLAGAGRGGGGAAQGVALGHPQRQERARPDHQDRLLHQPERHELSTVLRSFASVDARV